LNDLMKKRGAQRKRNLKTENGRDGKRKK